MVTAYELGPPLACALVRLLGLGIGGLGWCPSVDAQRGMGSSLR